MTKQQQVECIVVYISCGKEIVCVAHDLTIERRTKMCPPPRKMLNAFADDKQERRKKTHYHMTKQQQIECVVCLYDPLNTCGCITRWGKKKKKKNVLYQNRTKGIR